MTEKEYHALSGSIARKLGIGTSCWTDGENLSLIAHNMPDEILQWVIDNPKLEQGWWIPGWVEVCKRELRDRSIEEIIFKG